MFEKEAEDAVKRIRCFDCMGYSDCLENNKYYSCNVFKEAIKNWKDGFQKGAEFGYNKTLEEVKHDLMMKLKDEGLVKPLKDSILRNERLSSQEQQELCAWIECAMDFGENLDECAKELEEANKANEWHFVKDGDLPKDNRYVLIATRTDVYRGFYENNNWYGDEGGRLRCIAWKELSELPKEIKEK